MTMHTPPHPGHMLKMVFDNDCDKERQLEIRHEIGDGRLAEIMNETSDIDPHTAFLLEKMGVSSSEFWNRLQENYNNSLALPGYDFKPLKCLRVIDIDTGEILLETSSFFLFYNATFNIMERDSVERIMFEAVLESGHVINISQKTIDFETSLQVRLDKDTLSIARSPCGNILLKKEGTPVHEYLTVLDFGGYDEDLRVTQTGVDLSNTLASIKTQGDIGSTHITNALVEGKELRLDILKHKSEFSEKLLGESSNEPVVIQRNTINNKLKLYYKSENVNEAYFDSID